MTVKEAVCKCNILKDIKPESVEKLINSSVVRKYEKNEFIFRERESVNRFYFLVSGYAALYKMNRNDDRKVIFISGSGEMLNEEITESPAATVSCYSLGNVTVLSIARDCFLEVLKIDSGLMNVVLRSSAIKIRRLYRQLGNTSNMMHLEDQISSKLWKLAKDFGVEKDGYIKIDFDMSITFLADMVGAKRESVSRIMKRLGEKNLVKVERNRFLICDADGLKRNL